MAPGSPTSAGVASVTARQPPAKPIIPSIWQAPLVPAALILTAGIVADRGFSIPLAFSLVILLVGLMAWSFTCFGRQSNPVHGQGTLSLGLIYLGLALAAFGAAYHHWQ